MENSLHVGELKPIRFMPNTKPPAIPPISLTGATVTMAWWGPDLVRKTASMTVVGDGSYASYDVGVNDFPVSGEYQAQWVAEYPGGSRLISDIQVIFVEPVL